MKSKEYEANNPGRFEAELKKLINEGEIKEVSRGIFYTKKGGLIIPYCITSPFKGRVHGISDDHIKETSDLLKD